ncbi:hypothetical protein [Thermoflavimicrobium daqui]|uniref:PD-(D/E)XK endonuclease-like domain-containing protein n=1 Tax=Thermoflavimicrobium daqui TaxID=2137476 RepID=A0A364K160_9BACL|nr:hypothetical protein [Thermoflavimicrobium daqui]RAL21421.1 hypothetical protein DL897_16370 [Thermoflavimicrobium daqui]
MFRVETYQDPREYFSTLELEKDALHITGDSSLRLFLRNKNPRERNRILTYEELQQKLFPKWTSPFAHLLLKSKMREVIQQLCKDQIHLQRSMIASLDPWVERFRFLVELSLTQIAPPQDQSQLTPERVLFVQVWERLLADGQVRRLLFSRQKMELGQRLEQALGKRPRALYVYQMIQMDASRVYFFLQCAQHHIPVIFRIPYLSSLPKVYSPWKKVYEKIAGHHWPDDQQEVLMKRGQKWASYISDEVQIFPEKDEATPQFYQFASPIHFQRYLEQNPIVIGKKRILANSSIELNQVFRESNSLVKNPFTFAQLPCNRFFFHLYQCQKKDGSIYLEYQNLVECLTSGWIMVKEVNGIEAHSLLFDLEPYMKGARHIDEIIDRIQQLKALQESSELFDQQAREKTGRNKIKRYLSNPLRLFPYVHKSRYSITLKQLETLVIRLKQVALQLLPEEGKDIYLKEHFRLLKELFKQVKSHLPFGSEEAKEGMEKIFQTTIFEYWHASRKELSEWMSILLSRPIFESVETEGDIDNLDQLEGLVIQTKDIHVTDLSLYALNHYAYHTDIAPLTFPWLKELGKMQFSPEDPRSRMYRLALYVHYQCHESTREYLPFQIFYLLAFSQGEVTFSWIQDLRDHDEKGLLLETLYLLYGDQEEEIPYWHEPVEETRWNPGLSQPQQKIDGKPLHGQIPTVYWLDKDFCARKFFLTSLIELQPIYESDYHQRIAFGILAKLFAQQYDGEENVFAYLFPLFPQWNETLKKNLYQTQYPTDLYDDRSFQNLSYPKDIGRLQRLYSLYQVTKRWKVKNAYRHDREHDSQWLQEWLESIDDKHVKAETGQHCSMCPYLMICDKGEFSIDRQ